MTNSNGATNYKIHWAKQAANYLERLDKTTKTRIISYVESLASDQTDQSLDIKPLTGRPGLFRLRVGKYRVIFSIEEEIRIILVSTIMPRGEVYKRI